MARFGSPFAAGYGNPENAVAAYRDKVLSGGSVLRRSFLPSTQFGNAFFGVYRNARLMANQYVAEGVYSEPVYITADRPAPGATSLKSSVLVLRIGHLAEPSYSIPRVARTFESADTARLSIFWDWNVGLESLGSLNDGGKLSAWTFSGLNRKNVINTIFPITRGYLKVNMTVVGSNATVEVSNLSGVLCSGSGAFPGTIALAAQNGSGVTMGVTVASGAVSKPLARAYFRWPASYKIKRDTVNPPTTVVAQPNFTGVDGGFWTEPTDLAAGTYYYRTTPVSDTNVDAADSTVKTVLIPGAPEPPGAPTYASGNAAATLLNQVASVTPGATYRVYLQQIGATTMNLNAPVLTPGAGTVGIALPAITGYPGIARVLVRAVNGGVEEKNGQMIELNYDNSGVYLPPVPNQASLLEETQSVTSGLNLSIVGTYYTAEELGVATQLQLFVRDANTANYGAAVATAGLGTANGGVKRATLTYTLPANGLYYVMAKALTAAGGVSNNQSNEVLIDASNVSGVAIEPTISLSRG